LIKSLIDLFWPKRPASLGGAFLLPFFVTVPASGAVYSSNNGFNAIPLMVSAQPLNGDHFSLARRVQAGSLRQAGAKK